MKKKELARRLGEAELRIARLEGELRGLRGRQTIVTTTPNVPPLFPNYVDWPQPLRVTCGSVTITAPKGVTINNDASAGLMDQVDATFRSIAETIDSAIS